MKVDIQEVASLMRRRAEINRPLLSELEFYDGDTRIDVDPATIDCWELCGLTNTDFVTSILLQGEPQIEIIVGYDPSTKSATIAEKMSSLDISEGP